MNRTLATLALALVVSACATTTPERKTMTPLRLTQADGTIEMGTDYGFTELIIINDAASKAVAKSRCEGWGYTDVEPVGSQEKSCINPSVSGCMRTRVVMKYQCTGQS